MGSNFFFSVFCVRKTKTPSMRQRSNGKPSILSFMSNLCTWHRPLSFPSKVCISLFGTGEKAGLTSMLVRRYSYCIPNLIRRSHLIFLSKYLKDVFDDAWLKEVAFIAGKSENQAAKKCFIHFFIENLIANIRLYALSWPKLNFGCYLTFEIIF